jgi:ribosomal protein S18 acetylase RimI-like enzyme
MTIRPAKVTDVPGVLPMVERICAMHKSLDLAKYGFLPDLSRRYDWWLKQRAADPRSVFLVAEREAAGGEGGLVGFLVATVDEEIPIYQLKEYGFIQDLWVEEPYRNEGLGRQMVMLAVERLKEMGVRQVRCDTAAGNEPARRLFEACGFRASTVEMLLEV